MNQYYLTPEQMYRRKARRNKVLNFVIIPGMACLIGAAVALLNL